jgi:5-methylcytosine-specific restriction endonuclease McrA
MKRTRLRRRKLVPRGTVTNKMLDDACRAVVFARDGYRCLMCGTTARLQWSHIRNRSYKKIMWHPLNSKTLCAGCHKFKWHTPPPGFDPLAWLETIFPGRLAAVDALYFANRGKRIDRKLTLLWLQQELKRYQRERPEGVSLGARTG